MIGRMVWWESAAAPNRDEQPPEVPPQSRGRQKPNQLKSNEVLGSFGFTRHVGFGSVGAAAWVRSVARRLEFSDGPAATGPRLNGRWEFYPISAALTTAI